jgi:hypothetical protein
MNTLVAKTLKPASQRFNRCVTALVLLSFTATSVLPSAAYAQTYVYPGSRPTTAWVSPDPMLIESAMRYGETHNAPSDVGDHSWIANQPSDALRLATAPMPHASLPPAHVAVGGTQSVVEPNAASGPLIASPETSPTATAKRNIASPRMRVRANSVRSPFLTDGEFAAGFNPEGGSASASQPGAVTAKNLPLGLTAPPSPTAADLAETEDTQVSPAIRTLATGTLNRNPVAIFNWVRNGVQFTPTYGSIQGAAMTLESKRGNAFDTASLLIALYRSAGIPARYAYGTIEIPIAQLQNWVGGVVSAEAALALLAQGGIPNQSVVSAGRISAVRLEHVWVEAWVDLSPSRGAINRSPNAWLPIDASFKQSVYTSGFDVRVTVPLDATALANAIKTGATFTADSASNLNTPALSQAFAAWQVLANNQIIAQRPSVVSRKCLYVAVSIFYT